MFQNGFLGCILRVPKQQTERGCEDVSLPALVPPSKFNTLTIALLKLAKENDQIKEDQFFIKGENK